MNKMNLHKKLLNAIKRGTGEAHLIVMQHPEIDFSKEILEGIKKNFAYDCQCEGSRDRYIFDLINFSTQKEFLIEQACKELYLAKNDSWDLFHLYDIVCLFALDGSKDAKKHIRKRFRMEMKEDHWAGERNLLKIDGIKGLLYIAQEKGEIFSIYGDEWEDCSLSYMVDNFQQENPAVNVMKILEKASKNNVFIQTYLEKYKEEKSKPKKEREKVAWNYNAVTERLNTKKFFILSQEKVSEISEEDILSFADDFLKEINEDRKIRYLRIFGYTKFPYDYHLLFNIVKETPIKYDNLLENAIKALHFFKADDIRAFALEKLAQTKDFEVYIFTGRKL